MPLVTAKFQVQEVTAVSWSPTTKIIKLRPCYDTSIPEDQLYSKATPSGEFTMQVDNPVAIERLELGKRYYIEIRPAT